MNVLFLTNKSPYWGRHYGGAESSIRLLASELAALGNRAVYVTRLRDNSLGVKLKRMAVDGVRVYAVGFFDRFRRFSLVARIQERLVTLLVSSLIKRHKIGVVYCFYELSNLQLLLRLRKRGLRFRIVMRMAGLHWYEACQKKPFLIPAYESAFNEVDSVNYIHAGLEEMVREKLQLLGMNVSFKHTFSGDIGTSAPIGRDDDYCPLDDGVFSLIMATRFSDYQKRQDILVRAIARLPETVPAKLCLFGSGARKDEIAALIRDLGVSDRVKIEPFADQQQLWRRMRRASLLCHACEYEGLGKIIIESMALGLPVLASNVAPLNEYIRDGDNGFLVDNSPEAWADRIVELYHNHDRLAHVSERSVDFIAQNYDPKKNVWSYQKAFGEIVSKGA